MEELNINGEIYVKKNLSMNQLSLQEKNISVEIDRQKSDCKITK